MNKVLTFILMICCLAVLTGCEEKTSNQKNSSEELAKKENSYQEEVSKDAPQKVVSTYETRDVSNSDVDIVVGDDYFATQLADMVINFDQYEGKTVEIEGMALENNGWTFVGRYSENQICPTCPVGYAYYEYEWHGAEPLNLGNEEKWIKVKGTLTRGDDNGEEYYYIDAYEIALMSKFGDVVTVVN